MAGSPAALNDVGPSTRMRDVARRIQADLFQPTRRRLTELSSARDAAIKNAEQTWAGAEAHYRAAEDNANRQASDIRTNADISLQRINGICAELETRLRSLGVAVSVPIASATSQATVSQVIGATALAERVAAVKQSVDTAKGSTLTGFWPARIIGRWALVAVSVLLFFIYYPLILAWPLIVFVLRRVDRRTLLQLLVTSHSEATEIRSALELLRDRVQKKVESDIRTAERGILQPARQERTKALADIESTYGRQVAEVRAQATAAEASVSADVDALRRGSAYVGAGWNDRLWEKWSPQSTPAPIASIGSLLYTAEDLSRSLPGVNFTFEIPALMSFVEGRCLLFEGTGITRDLATTALRSIVVRLLASTAPGKARFTFIDPVGVGHNVADFMRLGDIDADLIGGKAWSDPRQVEEQLGEITAHMEAVIQKYLRREYKSILEYNAQAEEVAEPFRFVVIFDFPVNFTDTAARQLVSIIRNGPPCGVFTVIARDVSKPLPHGFSESDLRSPASVVAWDPKLGTAHWHADGMANVPLKLDSVEAHQALVDRIIAQSGQAAKAAMSVQVPFPKVLSRADLSRTRWWKSSSAMELKVPLGPTGARRVQFLALGRGHELGHHALVVGRTGSGKTNLLHVIITSIGLAYAPTEVQLYLIDFKGGVGFKPYASNRLPHAAVIAIESEREFGLSVLDGLNAELDRRTGLFKEAAVDNFSDYREKRPSATLPRILLIVDEFQELFVQEDAIANRSRQILDRIGRQGRGFGIHMLLATQSLSGSAQLPASTVGQINIRIALPCSDADSRLILAHDNSAARLLSRPGEAIYNAAAGLTEGNNPFQVAMFSDRDLNEFFNASAELSKSAMFVGLPIVFEGNDPAVLQDCKPLSLLLNGSIWPASHGAVRAWLGEPVAIRPPTEALFDAKPGRHLLIVTRNEEEGVGVLYAAWLSLLAQHRPTTAKFYFADLSAADTKWHSYSDAFREAFPHQIDLVDPRAFALLLSELNGEMKQRLDSQRTAAPSSQRYLCISGMHRIRDLRASEPSFSSMRDLAEVSTAEMLATLLRDGSEAGIHVLAWCDTVSNARRALDRRLGDFGVRVAGPMSIEDSNLFVDASDAAKLTKEHRLVLSDEEKPGVVEKFRPYGLPELEWAVNVAARQRQWQ